MEISIEHIKQGLTIYTKEQIKTLKKAYQIVNNLNNITTYFVTTGLCGYYGNLYGIGLINLCQKNLLIFNINNWNDKELKIHDNYIHSFFDYTGLLDSDTPYRWGRCSISEKKRLDFLKGMLGYFTLLQQHYILMESTANGVDDYIALKGFKIDTDDEKNKSKKGT